MSASPKRSDAVARPLRALRHPLPVPALAALAASLLLPRATRAQVADADAADDSIAVIERGTPAINGWDVAEAPFRLLTLPIFLLGKGAELMVGGEGYLIPNVLHAIGEIHARGVHPAVYKQGPNSGLGGALLLGLPPDRPGPWAHAVGGATVKGYWSVAARVGYGEAEPEPRERLLVRRGGPFTAQGWAFAAHRAEDEFYGIGRTSPESDRSDYDREQYGAGAAAAVRPRPEVELRAFGGWSQDETGGGGDDRLRDVSETFAPAEIPGFGERLRYVTLGTTAGWREGHPHSQRRRSRWAEAGYAWNESSTAGAADFGRLQASAGIELPFDRRRESVLFALRYENVRPQGEGEIAFYHLPSLGGSRTLPSYRSERFRGREAILGQAEYRYRVWSEPRDALWFDTVLFLYGGMVAESLAEEFRFERLKESFGVAFAFMEPEAELARITLAWGDEGFRARFIFRYGP